MTGAWRGTERLGRCIEAMLPKASLPRSVQHRWALRQATQCPPGVYSGLKSSRNRSYPTALINERAPVDFKPCFFERTVTHAPDPSCTCAAPTRCLRAQTTAFWRAAPPSPSYGTETRGRRCRPPYCSRRADARGPPTCVARRPASADRTPTRWLGLWIEGGLSECQSSLGTPPCSCSCNRTE